MADQLEDLYARSAPQPARTPQVTCDTYRRLLFRAVDLLTECQHLTHEECCVSVAVPVPTKYAALLIREVHDATRGRLCVVQRYTDSQPPSVIVRMVTIPRAYREEA